MAVALALWRRSPAAAGLGAAAAYLLAHNAAALTLRWRGLRLGYEWKETIAVRLQGLHAQQAIRLVRWAGFSLAAAACLVAVVAAPQGQKLPVVLALGAFLAFKALPARLSVYGLYAATCATGAAAAAAGWL